MQRLRRHCLSPKMQKPSFLCGIRVRAAPDELLLLLLRGVRPQASKKPEIEALLRALVDGTINGESNDQLEALEPEEAAEHHLTNPILVSHRTSSVISPLLVRNGGITIMSLLRVPAQLLQGRPELLGWPLHGQLVVLELPPPDPGVELRALLRVPLLAEDDRNRPAGLDFFFCVERAEHKNSNSSSYGNRQVVMYSSKGNSGPFSFSTGEFAAYAWQTASYHAKASFGYGIKPSTTWFQSDPRRRGC